MSGPLHEREKGYEAKFAHDEEVRFLIRARRDKLFARWAAAELRLSEAETEAVVQAVLAIKDGPMHERALKDHVGQLLRGRPQGSDDALSAALDRCQQDARAQLGGGIA